MRIVRTSLALAALVLLVACGSDSSGVVAPGDRASRSEGTYPGGAITSSDSTSRGLGQIGSGN